MMIEMSPREPTMNQYMGTNHRLRKISEKNESIFGQQVMKTGKIVDRSLELKHIFLIMMMMMSIKKQFVSFWMMMMFRSIS